MPKPHQKDSRGQEIDIGTRVAFNYSGSIAIGTVEKVLPGTYHIRRETHLSGYGGHNPISKVRNIRNLIAINEVDDIAKKSHEHRLEVLQDAGKLESVIVEVELLQLIKDAWDIDDLKMALEERYGVTVNERLKDLEDFKEIKPETVNAFERAKNLGWGNLTHDEVIEVLNSLPVAPKGTSSPLSVLQDLI